MFKPGFITPPCPHVRGDSVSAASLITRIEKEAHRGCGLYYEIYNYRALSELMAVLTNLSAGDAETFIRVAANRGFSLDSSTRVEVDREYQKILTEIRREQE
jgi:hypothetical protein